MKNTMINFHKKSPIYSHNPVQAEDFPLLVLDVHRQVCVPFNEGFRAWHWHDEIQFIFVHQGILNTRIFEETLEIKAGCCLFINRSALHITTEKEDCHYHSFIIPEKMLSFYPGSSMEKNEVNAIIYNAAFTHFLLDGDNPQHKSAMKHLRFLDHLYFYHENDCHYAYRLNTTLVSFWLEFISLLPPMPTAVPPKEDARIRFLLSFLHNHYQENITVEDIASAANISKTECLRCFRKYIGDSPYQYLLKYRLHISTSLLKTTDKSVTEIAHETGFSSTSSYIKYFRKYYNCTPGQYRCAQ